MFTVSLMEYNTTPTGSTPTLSTDELYIFDPLTTDEGLMLTDPVLYLEASSAGSFNCNIPETNYGYGKIIKHRTRVVVRKDDKVIFMGRINSEERDLYLSEKIEAEGALAYLNDSLTEKKTYSYKSLPYILNDIFTNHNNKFSGESWKQFHFPYDSATDTSTNCHAQFTGRDDTNVNSNKLTQYNVNFNPSMDIITELLDVANAVLKIEYNENNGYWDVYIYNKYDYATDGSNFPVSSQPVEFGVNLLDLTKTNSFNDICTVVAPFGGDLIQESKEIGDVVAGKDVSASWNVWWGRHWYLRATDDVGGAYDVYPAESDGYWVFKLDIVNYNANHPLNPLKKLYISYRGFKGIYGAYTEDCAWRIYDGSGNTIGYKTYVTGIEGFDSAINEEIDLNAPEYLGAEWMYVCGWGGLVPSIIRRDATVVEENDKLTIENCEEFVNVGGLTHFANSPYLISNNLVDQYGVIEKKIEYDIEDSLIKVANFPYPTSGPYNDPYVYYDGVLGKITYYDGYMLGYNAGPEGTDLKSNNGNYEIKPLSEPGGGYACIEYKLPELDDVNRPRGVFVSCRMHDEGVIRYEDPNDHSVWYYKANGMFAVFDTVGQVLAYRSTGNDGFTSVKDYYIDLSDAKYYGAMTIRVGAWGGNIPPKAIPSDDKIAQDRLMAQAKLYLTSYQWEKVVIEATAVDLNMVNDEFERFDICTLIEVVSDYHGVYTYLPLTRLELHLDNYANTSLKVGYDSDSYLSYQLNESLRATSVEESIEERRKNNEYTS